MKTAMRIPCQNEKRAWMTQTNTRTMAKAKFAMDGGCPRGFQAIKTKMAAINKMEPNPPNR